MALEFPKQYWNNRYDTNETGWDIGYVSPPLQTYFDQLKDKEQHILIPGGGNAYEAEYLFKLGFTNTWLVDISENACSKFEARCPEFPKEQIVCGDFFSLNQTFDLIIEQTFFCALHPKEREQYVKQCHSLLSPTGKLVGLLFEKQLNTTHPPFGGERNSYTPLFETHFDIQIMETAYNSIRPRANYELFIKMLPKSNQ